MHQLIKYKAKHILSLFVIFLCMGTVVDALSTAPSKAPPQKKLQVVASFSILGDLVRQVGKDLVEVTIIVPENADPHVYQPNPRDARLLAKADLVFTNGLGFEGWLDRLIDNSGYKGSVVVAAKNVTARPLSLDVDEKSKKESAKDPHAWHSVQNALLYVDVIADALQNALPNQRAIIKENHDIYRKNLQILDKWIHQQYADIPASNRYVVTTHDAFWYYGEAYDVHFLAPVGISTDAEPAAAAVAHLIRVIRGKNIKAVFIENLANGKLIEEIAHEAKVSLGGVLYADSLSTTSANTKDAPASTYIDMVRHNTMEIVTALKE